MLACDRMTMGRRCLFWEGVTVKGLLPRTIPVANEPYEFALGHFLEVEDIRILDLSDLIIY